MSKPALRHGLLAFGDRIERFLMNRRCRLYLASLAIASASQCGVAQAERHIREVLRHTDDAVRAAGDAQSIGQHAADALELIDEAQEANASRPDVLEYLGRSEQELGSALRNARHFNSRTAWQDAVDAKRYLEAANQAADGKPPR